MFKSLLFIFIILSFGITPAFAIELIRRDPVLTFETSIGSTDKVVDGASGEHEAATVMQHATELKVRYAWRDADRNDFFLDSFIRNNTYPSKVTKDELIYGVFGEYRHKLAQNNKVQLRLRVGLEQSHGVFNRLTGQLVLRKRSGKTRANQFMLRYRYRDQDEAETFVGFDQHEFYASLQNTWTPKHHKIKKLSATIYGDVRQADASRFSYVEIGARAQIKFEPAANWTVIARTKLFVRNYSQNRLAKSITNRKDHRWLAEIEARYEFENKTQLYGELGWRNNQSNASNRDLSGITFGVGFKITDFSKVFK